MHDDRRSPEEIESEIERERSALAQTLDRLGDSLSMESILGQATDRITAQAGDVGQTVARAVRDNPIGAALTAVGIAMLLMPSKNRSDRDHDDLDRLYDDDDWAADPLAYRRASGVRPAGADADPYAPYHPATGADRARQPRPVVPSDHAAATRHGTWDLAEIDSDDDESNGYIASAKDGISRAKDDLSRHAADARHRAQSVRRDVAAGSRRTRARIAAKLRSLRDRIEEGTEDMSAEARSRVVRARAKALRARARAEEAAYDSARRTKGMYHDQPLLFGGLALAIGAAAGASLPRTRVEDDTFGAASDRLMEEAAAIYREERAHLERIGRAASDEARQMAAETARDVRDAIPEGKSVAQAAESRLRDDAARLAETVRKEAKSEGEDKIAKAAADARDAVKGGKEAHTS